MLVWTGILSGGVPGLSGRIHNLVYISHVSCHTILLLYVIKKFSLSYDTLQQVSHKILMETKEVWARTGMTCAHVDDLGSHGRSKLPVCVECSVFPYGKYMTRIQVDG